MGQAEVQHLIRWFSRCTRGQRWLVTGHWEGDLMKSKGNATGMSILRECTSRLLMLFTLQHPKPSSAANVLQALTDNLRAITQPLRKTLTCDQCIKMALNKLQTINTVVILFLCEPHSAWQRATKENTSGQVSLYLPKGSDLLGYSKGQLDAIDDEIKNRPCKG